MSFLLPGPQPCACLVSGKKTSWTEAATYKPINVNRGTQGVQSTSTDQDPEPKSKMFNQRQFRNVLSLSSWGKLLYVCILLSFRMTEIFPEMGLLQLVGNHICQFKMFFILFWMKLCSRIEGTKYLAFHFTMSNCSPSQVVLPFSCFIGQFRFKNAYRCHTRHLAACVVLTCNV